MAVRLIGRAPTVVQMATISFIGSIPGGPYLFLLVLIFGVCRGMVVRGLVCTHKGLWVRISFQTRFPAGSPKRGVVRYCSALWDHSVSCSVASSWPLIMSSPSAACYPVLGLSSSPPCLYSVSCATASSYLSSAC